MKLTTTVEPEHPFARLVWSLRRLGWPLLPRDVRLLRTQEAIDREAARKALQVFGQEGVTVTGLGSVPPGPGSAEPLVVGPAPAGGLMSPRSSWSGAARLEWDGQVLTVVGTAAAVVRLRPSGSGVRSGCRADEVARTGLRPTPTMAECPAAVVEIAAVAIEGRRMQRLYFLDEASRHLAVAPAHDFSEDDVAETARRAGIAFRIYWISTGPRVLNGAARSVRQRELRYLHGRLSPEEVCAAVFPPSARFQGVSQGMSGTLNRDFLTD